MNSPPLRAFLKPVVTVGRGTSARVAARRMKDFHVGSLVVVDSESRPIGMVTDRDLALGVLLSNGDADAVAVGEFMTSQPVTLPVSSSIVDVARTMRRRLVRRIPLTDGDGVVVGLVSADDVLTLLAGDLRWIAASTEVGIEAESPLGNGSAGTGSPVFGRE